MIIFYLDVIIMHKISKKIDFIAISITFFILLYIVFSNFFDGFVYCLILSALSVFILHLLIFLATKNKREKDKLKRAEEKHCEEIFLNLPFICEKDLYLILKKLFTAAGFDCKNENNILIAEKSSFKRVVIACFNKKADEQIIYKCEQMRQENFADGFILLCIEASDTAYRLLDLLKNNNNGIICKNRIYLAMKKHNVLPEAKLQSVKKRKMLKEIFAYAFARSRFKSYFVLATIMFLFSYITPFKQYYLIFAAVLFIFCIFSLINKKYNVKIVNNDLLD